MTIVTALRPHRSRTAPARPSALDRVVTRFARSHALHVSPIVGCYLCLHNEPRTAAMVLPAAA